MIELKHIYKTYVADKHILRDVNLKLNPSELIFVTGASGAGKTTLFNILAGLTPATSGEIIFNHKNLNLSTPLEIVNFRKQLGVVFQDSRLLKNMNVRQNIAVPLIIAKTPKSIVKQKVDEIVNFLGLESVVDNYPEHLSGGEQQRVSLARATIHSPQIIIADEPTGNLDADNEKKVIDFLKVKAEQGATVIVATHNLNLLKKYSARHLHLSQGQLSEETSFEVKP